MPVGEIVMMINDDYDDNYKCKTDGGGGKRVLSKIPTCQFSLLKQILWI